MSPEKKIDYWARSSERDEIIVVTAKAVEALDVDYAGIKDRHVLDIDHQRVMKLTATLNGKRLYAEKIKNIWDVLEPAEPLSRNENVETFLKTLEELKHEKLLDSSEATIETYGLKHPDLAVEMVGPEGGRHRLAVSLTPVDEKFLPARADEGPVVFIKKATILKALPEEIRPEEPKPSGTSGG